MGDRVPIAGNERSRRLDYIKTRFLDRRSLKNRKRPVPVVVKFSNDTHPLQGYRLLEMLFELDSDGVNFGNTSTDYAGLRAHMAREELGAFDFFTKKCGGGVAAGH